MQKHKGDNLYQCQECGLHYTDEAVAKKCAAWCSQYHSCNLEITKLSKEVQEVQNGSAA